MSIPAQHLFSKISTTLLQKIFEHFGANEPVQVPLQPLDPRYILSLVCRRWVATVRATSSFWSNIRFTRPVANTLRGPQPHLHHFALCTSRSGQAPLSIDFDMVCIGWKFSIVRRIIIPHVYRIKTLRCIIYGDADIYRFFTIQEGSFSSLESLEICFINTWDNPVSSFPLRICLRFNALRTAPRLRNAIVRLENSLYPLDLHLPWSQLTTLDLGTKLMSPEVFVEILHAAAIRLENGFFSITFTKPSNPHLALWPRRSITMKTLRKLRLRLLFPNQDPRLFSLLRLPSLQTLTLEMHNKFQNWDIALYTKLLQTSKKSLQQLHMIDYPYPGSPDELDSSLVVRRRQRNTSSHVLDKFLKVMVNVQNLNLPVGLEIPAPTLVKISTCKLLPQLHVLELGTVNARLVLSMARIRHARWLHASLAEPEFETGHSQILVDCQRPGPLRYINMLIPHHGYSAEERAALIEEAGALRVLDITFYIHTTLILPLPVLNLGRKTVLTANSSFLAFGAQPARASGI